jgi:hypothetical protein
MASEKREVSIKLGWLLVVAFALFFCGYCTGYTSKPSETKQAEASNAA